ncbi:alpha-ketoglutarate-dependent dioxygenase AlkB [Brachybacterium halotolerans subsp. kimchii]|uniref:alpha-ketoglutarate-dependent dioxygenase AlkB family protein n=1 Tax=Brachybacterium halotolerans TaxID=2795215 RepID=UPI001E31CFB7|nr:alpha-ketoglutarate-dependent dioxygenase AlkB [Brachybacterium halotolerans]UEJ82059.1 alpha-ketoglutarate-dependent dioxygenase AlkB [Brachybacterium halotolerans subsp. kimchii]
MDAQREDGSLFGDDLLPRPARALGPGAVWVPGFLRLDQQAWISARFEEWADGPVPPRSPKVRGHEMSVRTVCLGWHWRPYAYSREAVDVNGNRVLPFPDWMTRLGRSAIAAAAEHDPELAAMSAQPDTSGAPGGRGSSDSSSAPSRLYSPDTALVNHYSAAAKMGMHQDKDERSLAPVVSLSIGDACTFRFGNTEARTKPYEDITLESGDLFVFGGPARLAFHGVTRIQPGTAPEGCGITEGRLNITLRETGLEG